MRISDMGMALLRIAPPGCASATSPSTGQPRSFVVTRSTTGKRLGASRKRSLTPTPSLGYRRANP
jgi:hypothetical protein